MKKLLSVLCVFALTIAVISPAFAGEAADKAKGGLELIFKSPMQISENVQSEYDSAEFKPFGVIGGTLKGIALMVKDVLVGTVDVVTSPLELMGE